MGDIGCGQSALASHFIGEGGGGREGERKGGKERQSAFPIATGDGDQIPINSLLIDTCVGYQQQAEQQPPPTPQQGASSTRMEEGAWDLTQLAEEDFEQLAVYIVPDAVVEAPATGSQAAAGPATAGPGGPASGAPQGRNRSELSLPRNLALKSSQALSDVLGVWSSGYIPRGTRFGPLVGDIYAKDHVPKHANRKYFWRVSVCVCLCVSVHPLPASSSLFQCCRADNDTPHAA